MLAVHDKLKSTRKRLGFSQGYVARRTGITESDLAAMERGSKSPSELELDNLRSLYRLSAGYLHDGSVESMQQPMFARGSDADLAEQDQIEILNLLAFRQTVTA